MDTIISLIILILIGVADLVLIFTGNKTISQFIHKMFPQRIDILIMVGMLGAIAAYLGWEEFVWVMWGTIIGHLFWHEGG